MKRFLTLILAVVMLFSTPVSCIFLSNNLHSATTITVQAASVKYKTTANLNLRKKADEKSSKIITVPKDSTVTSDGKTSGNYQYITYTKSGKTYKGWVLKQYLKKTSTASSTTKTTKYTTTAELNMRSKADEKSSKVITVPKGASVTSTGKVSGKYQYVTYTKSSKSYKGWVLKQYLKKTSTASTATKTTKYTTTAELNMRSKADEKSSKVITVPKGASVTSTGKVSGKYQYVTYTKSSKSYKGWVLKQYLKKAGSSSTSSTTKPTTTKPVVDNSPVQKPHSLYRYGVTGKVKSESGLALRKGPGTHHKLALEKPMKNGTKIVCYGYDYYGDDWIYVYVESSKTYGWCSIKYTNLDWTAK